MSKRQLIVISTLCTLVGGSVAAAHPGFDKRFAKIDANGDGSLSAQELENHALARFNKADVNRDGKVTLDERSAQREEGMKQRLVQGDLNGDGVLERSEVERMPEAWFSKLDADKSGGLSVNELKAFARGQQAERGLRSDSDGDGAVSQSEMLAKARTRFASLDSNHDGKLSEEEFNAEHRNGQGWEGLGSWSE
jgi:Ca2+-binding EF-hand superfamily protein